jgi:O-antigen ligase
MLPPYLAFYLWLILLVALLSFDPAKHAGTSLALWVPVIWMFIVGSRLPSQWVSGHVGLAAGTLEEGNPWDRSVFLVLILLAIGILMSRSFNWSRFFACNIAGMAFISFALVSVCWSDFPFVAFKRWFRDLGNYVVILVALSDTRPLEAVRTLLRRLGYLLIPLSLLLVKYYPDIGMQYNIWTGTAMYVGPTTSKNGLGIVCLVSGLFFFWDTVVRWSDRKQSRNRRIILVNLAFLAMTLYLMHVADSATSRLCLAIGCLVITAAHSKAGRRRHTVLRIAIPACLCLYITLAFGFGINLTALLAEAVGRNPTLTGRTDIWDLLLTMHTNPLVGTGYGSFWLGPRLNVIWQSPVGAINEAHNGYLELYLNLGLIGLFLFAAFLIGSYRSICRRLRPFSSFASLTLALWTVTLIYNVTEAAFSWQYMWVTFLIGAIAAPVPFHDPIPTARSSTASRQVDLPVFT